MTFGPIEPSITGNLIDLPVASSVSVIEPFTAPTLGLLPSIAAPQGNARRRLASLPRRIGRGGWIIKRRSNFAMQYRECEKLSFALPQRPRCARGFPRAPAPP